MLPNVEIDSLMPNESWPIESCDKGWEYNKTDVQSSIVIDVSLTPFLPTTRFHSIGYDYALSMKIGKNIKCERISLWGILGENILNHLFVYI